MPKARVRRVPEVEEYQAKRWDIPRVRITRVDASRAQPRAKRVKEARMKSAVVPETIPESAAAATPATATTAVEAKDYRAAGALAAAKTQDKEVEDTGSKLKAMTLCQHGSDYGQAPKSFHGAAQPVLVAWPPTVPPSIEHGPRHVPLC